MPVGGTSTYFDTAALADGSAPAVANSSNFFNATVAANHKEGAEELALLKYVYARPDLAQLRGDPDAVCNAIDDFAATIPRGLMTIGADKRAFITRLLAGNDSDAGPAPTTFLEFGSYVGYSAICLASAMAKRAAGTGRRVRYLSFEKNPIIAAVAASLCDLAGLRDVVSISVGSAGESLGRLVKEGVVGKGEVDFVLLDHWKDFYIDDLQICEKESLLRPGSVVLADNIVFPGAPEYLAYAQRGRAEKSPEGYAYVTETADFVLPFGGPDQLAISTVA
ncbi:catechol o-methyltransferase [Diplodia corticola]|uniref:catechol O-methyltransferase n=1 Tax=Diplodia corticola TaxID=236234 RepID=A0A1J9QMG4_9PEZI|nr:catechol o-methyltransferase [Diplodia corticola]OJD29665.1 catechol o-methyltransferase [Diplodia corticola]